MMREIRVSEQPFNYQIKDFDGAMEYISEMIGSDFDRAIRLTNAIIENPTGYTGPQASMAAIKLAAYRVKIGEVAQSYKQISTATKKPTDRLIKDALLCLYDGLLELINCLKAAARNEREVIVSG